MKRVAVADLKRELDSILESAERGETTIIVRHGEAVAQVAPVSESERRMSLPTARRQGGLLAVAGLLASWEDLASDMAEVVASRQTAHDRPAPELG